jgi:predicted site-specific integrase-resolvase
METRNDKLLSARSAREHLGGVSEMTIWRWVRSGILAPPIKINKRNYFLVSAVERVKAGTAKAGV